MIPHHMVYFLLRSPIGSFGNFLYWYLDGLLCYLVVPLSLFGVLSVHLHSSPSLSLSLSLFRYLSTYVSIYLSIYLNLFIFLSVFSTLNPNQIAITSIFFVRRSGASTSVHQGLSVSPKEHRFDICQRWRKWGAIFTIHRFLLCHCRCLLFWLFYLY